MIYCTKEQRTANDMDCELYKLLCAAESLKWGDVAEALRKARPLIRKRMHPKDQQETI